MDRLIKELKERGCDIEGAMNRFLGDEQFYIQCFRLLMTDENFQKLEMYLEKEMVREAFEAAHSLKGVIANMGLTPLYALVVKIVEPLRNGDCKGLLPICHELLAEKQCYEELLSQIDD